MLIGRGVFFSVDIGVVSSNDGEEDYVLGLFRITVFCEKGFKRVLIILVFWFFFKIWDINNVYILETLYIRVFICFLSLICYEKFVVRSRYVGICFVDN